MAIDCARPRSALRGIHGAWALTGPRTLSPYGWQNCTRSGQDLHGRAWRRSSWAGRDEENQEEGAPRARAQSRPEHLHLALAVGTLACVKGTDGEGEKQVGRSGLDGGGLVGSLIHEISHI